MHWPMAFKQTNETTFPVKNGLVEFDEDIDYIDTWKAVSLTTKKSYPIFN